MTDIHQIVEACRNGTYSGLVGRTPSGWVVMSNKQVVNGYCLLMPDPVVPDLNALKGQVRFDYLSEMSLVGDALLKLTDAIRINYAIFGNLEPALHAHIAPRYVDEPEDVKTKHIWAYDWGLADDYSDEVYGDLKLALRKELGL